MKTSKFNPHKVDRTGVPYKIIPKEQRLKAYQSSLDAIINKIGDSNEGLCVRLVHEVDLDFMNSIVLKYCIELCK